MAIWADKSALDIATLILACSLLVLHAGIYLWRSGLRAKCRRVRQACTASVPVVLAALRSLRLHRENQSESLDKEEEAMRVLADQRFKQWQAEMAHKAITLLVCMSTLNVLSIAYSLLAGTARWMSREQDAVQIVFYIILLVLDFIPRLVTDWTLKLVHSAVMLNLLVHVSPWGAPPLLIPILASFVSMAQLLFVCMIDSVLLFSVWNTLISATAVYSFTYGDADMSIIMQRTFMTVEFANVFISTGAFAIIVKTKKAYLRHCVEGTAHKREKVALSTILETTCDVVVELDEALCIMDDTPKLSSMLLHGPDRSLNGVELHQLLSSEAERERYTRQMTSGTDQLYMAQVLHTHMRDGVGNDVQVQMFHVQFDSVKGQPHRLVGIREFNDVPGLARLPSETGRLRVKHSANSGGMASHAGTPSAARQEALSEVSSQTSSRRASAGGRDLSRALPQCRKTDYTSKVLQIGTMLMSWNFSILHAKCCTYHSALGELRQVVTSMSKEECKPVFAPMSGWQCRHCGLLDVSDAEANPTTGRCLVCATIAGPQESDPSAPPAEGSPAPSVAGDLEAGQRASL